MTDEKFQIPPDFDLDEYLGHSFKVIDDDLYTVKVRISPGWATIRKMPDKSVEMTFQVAGLDEIKQWLLSLGPEAEVIEPKRLKELIRQDLKKTLSKYEKGTYGAQQVMTKHKTFYQDNRMGKQNF